MIRQRAARRAYAKRNFNRRASLLPLWHNPGGSFLAIPADASVNLSHLARRFRRLLSAAPWLALASLPRRPSAAASRLDRRYLRLETDTHAALRAGVYV